MKLLLQAALRSRRHLSLLIVTFATLLALTVASQLEMFALGVLSNNGADFFTLFSQKQEHVLPADAISLEQVQGIWKDIDKYQYVNYKSSALIVRTVFGIFIES